MPKFQSVKATLTDVFLKTNPLTSSFYALKVLTTGETGALVDKATGDIIPDLDIPSGEDIKEGAVAVIEALRAAVPTIVMGSLLTYGGYRVINDIVEHESSLISVRVEGAGDT